MNLSVAGESAKTTSYWTLILKGFDQMFVEDAY